MSNKLISSILDPVYGHYSYVEYPPRDHYQVIVSSLDGALKLHTPSLDSYQVIQPQMQALALPLGGSVACVIKLAQAGGRVHMLLAGRHDCRQTLGLRHKSLANATTCRGHC